MLNNFFIFVFFLVSDRARTNLRHCRARRATAATRTPPEEFLDLAAPPDLGLHGRPQPHRQPQAAQGGSDELDSVGQASEVQQRIRGRPRKVGFVAF